MSPALAGRFLATREAWVPQFGVIFWFTRYGKGGKELHRKLFSWFGSLPFFLSSLPPAHSKTTNSFSSSPRAVSWSSVTAWSLRSQHGKCSSKFLKRLLIPTVEKEMATHSGVLAWRILWMEGPGGLQSVRLQRVGQDWETDTHWFLQRYVKIGKMIHFSLLCYLFS